MEEGIVHINHEEESIISDSSTEILLKKSRGKNLKWVGRELYDSEEIAVSQLTKDFYLGYTNKPTIGTSKIYYCKMHGKCCPVKRRIFFSSKDSTIAIYKSNNEAHTGQKSQMGISDNVKEDIKILLTQGVVGPLNILENLKVNNVQNLPSYLQTRNYIAYVNSKNKSVYNSNDFKMYCESNKSIPIDEDQAYVIDYLCNESNGEIQAIISTKRMLKYLELSQSIHIDTTFGISLENYSTTIAGVSDKMKVFHPCAISLSYKIRTEDYQFFFNGIKNGLSALNIAYQPVALIADNAISIERGFELVFGYEYIRINCWYHVNAAYIPKLKEIKCIDLRKNIENDIYILQNCPTYDSFISGFINFLRKYESSLDDDIIIFITYFKTQWLFSNSGWYRGVFPGIAITNNGMESYNSSLKGKEFLRKKLKIGDFHF